MSKPKDINARCDNSTEKIPAIFVIILSAPKNIMQRKITRQTLKAVSNKDMKWAFIIGKTIPDTQVGKDASFVLN